MITVGDIKSAVAKVVKLCSTDAAVYDFMSRASERLIWKGHYHGAYGTFHVQSSDRIIAWPRELESIDGLTMSNVPLAIRGEWYEFVESGVGTIDTTNETCPQVIDRGFSPLFRAINSGGANKKIRISSSSSSDNGKLVLVQGLDSNGLPVRSEYPVSSGTYIDGKYLAINTPYVETGAGDFSVITGVQKAVTNGHLTVVEYDTVTAVSRTIAQWLSWETRPQFRLSEIPMVATDTATQYVVKGKLAPRIYRSDLDWVIPSNAGAMVLMCKALWHEDNDNIDESGKYEGKAQIVLEEQINHIRGAQRDTFAVIGTESNSARGVYNTQ